MKSGQKCLVWCVWEHSFDIFWPHLYILLLEPLTYLGPSWFLENIETPPRREGVKGGGWPDDPLFLPEKYRSGPESCFCIVTLHHHQPHYPQPHPTVACLWCVCGLVGGCDAVYSRYPVMCNPDCVRHGNCSHVWQCVVPFLVCLQTINYAPFKKKEDP